jgi:cytochrome P450
VSGAAATDAAAERAPVRPRGPKGAPFVGSLFAMRKDPLGFFVRAAREYGDVVRCRILKGEVYFLVHPDHVREVLVARQHDFMKGRGIQWAKTFLGEGLLTSEGEFHTRQRRLSQPAFHRQRLQAYGAVMTDFAVRAAARWRDGGTVDMAREMNALTMAVVGKTLFDADVLSEADEIGASLTAIVSLFHRFNHPFAALVNRLPLPSNIRFARARERLDGIIYRIVAERRASGRDHGDLLSMLLLARDDEGDGGRMTDRQLRDEVMTLFLAGHETTANALTWTLYLLAQNPEAEAALHDELRAVLGGRVPTAEDIPALRVTEGVFAEAMRLFPPAWGLGRKALRDVDLGGFTIPAGAFVVLSPYVTHRDPRFFPDPLRFDPGRFTPEARAARPKFAYFPFGGGARGCIGEPFAWMEGVLLLATLAERFSFRVAPGQRVAPHALITLRPRYGMRMVLRAREAQVQTASKVQ